MGSDVSYICISPGKYKIIAKVYRDCRGIPLDNPTINAFSPSCGSSVAISYTRTAINDITPVCFGTPGPCNPQNTTVGAQGIEEHVFEGTVDFNTSPFDVFIKNKCCQVYFSVEQCCRNGAITTLTQGNLFTEAMIDLCNIKGKCNTSPQLSIPPVAYICCNMPFTFNNGAREIIDGDSLHYSLANPLNGHGSNETYQGAFTPTIPMTPFCLPPGVINCKALPNAKPPRGLYFDENSGDIIFTPSKCDEVGVIVIQIDEYRKDSATGQYQLVGTTRRDMQLVVTKCADNNPPTIPTNNKQVVCEGNKICFTIQSRDARTINATRDDTTQLSWNYGIPGATFRIIDPTAREKAAEFCWQTKIGDARDYAYQFTVTAVDDNCNPAPAKINKGFLITVKAKAQANRKYEKLDCGKLRFTSFPKDTVNYKGNYNYEWTIRDSTNSGLPYYKSFKKLDSFKFKRGGKYIITHTINNLPINCPTIYTDTVIIPPVLDVRLTFGKDTFVCAGDSLVIKPIIAYGVPNFKFHWETPLGTFKSKDTLNRYAIKPSSNTTIMLRLTDKNKCVDQDTIKVKYQPNPVVNLGLDKRICTYDTYTLDAQNADTMRYFWTPDGDSTRLKTINVAGKYTVKVIDYLGCHTSDTMELFVNDTVVAIAKPDREICIQDTLKVKADRRPKGYTRQFAWTDLNTGILMASDSSFKTKIIQQADRKYQLSLKVTQSAITCNDLDTLFLKVNPLPVMGYNLINPRCFADGAINLSLKPTGYATDQNGDIHKDLRYFMMYKKPSWITGGPVGSAPYVYNYPLFTTNAKVPQTGLKDTICFEYRDFKGCYNYMCKPIKLFPDPLVHIKNGIFCQKAGPINLDKQVDTPFNKTGGIQSYRVISVPNNSGVDPDAILSDDINSFPPIKRILDVGLEGENQKTGDYLVEYCFKNPNTSCQRCDTAKITVIRLPEIQFDPLPSQCINYPQLALDSFVIEKNSGLRFLSGMWSCIALGGSRDKNIPAVANAINNSVQSQKYFVPKTGSGQYLLKFRDTASGCPVTDSTEINVNGLPKIQMPRPDSLCSNASPVQLTSNYAINDPNGKWSGSFVTGSTFDPTQSPKSVQYEGPYKLVFKYTNPLTKCSDTGFTFKTVQTLPVVKITNASPYQLCERDTFKIQSTNSFITKGVKWTTSGDGKIFTPGLPDTKYYQGRQDTVNGGATLTVTTNPEGVCPQQKADLTLVLQAYPEWDMPTHFVACEPATIDFTTTLKRPASGSNVNYSWYYGNGDSLLNSTNANPQGIKYANSIQKWYNVKLVVDNQWGALPTEVCRVTRDSQAYVRVLPQPKAGFSSDPGFFTTVAFPKFKFFNETKIKWGPMTYLWNFDNQNNPDDTSTQMNPIHTYPADTTIYWVYLKSSFTYPRSQDSSIADDIVCWDTISQKRKIGPDVTVFVPTAFSPEGTGPKLNNTFYAVVNGEKSFHIELFNRWGELLWETDNKYETWNGRYKNGDCQQDVYAWKVNVTAYDGKEYKYEGTVTLLR